MKYTEIIQRPILYFTLFISMFTTLAASAESGTERMNSDTETSSPDHSIERRIELLAATSVSRIDRLPGQTNEIKVKAIYDKKSGIYFIDLGRGFVPNVNSGDFEDQLKRISTEVMYRMDDVHPSPDIDFLFGGYDIFHYFPEDWRAAPNITLKHAQTLTTPKVMISAGHGLYYHHTYKDWRARRDQLVGMTD